MKSHSTPCILHIKSFSHSGHDHNREFQTFAFMNRHYPYRVCMLIFYTCFSVIYIVFLKLFNISYKMKQSFVACSFKRLCFFHQHQHIQICFPLCTSRHGCNIISISGCFQYLPEQFMHRCIRYNLSKVIHLIQTFLKFQLYIRILSLFSVLRHTLKECRIRICTPYFCQFFLR